MPATILVGAQWGDEGKGRVADWLAAESDVVARFAGGDNAGHTVFARDQVFKLHLIPSGVLHDHVTCVMGNGVVVNPISLLREIEELRDRGISVTPERLAISTRAHIITPAHIALDHAHERARGVAAIGTTLRGIGPAYLDKAGRQGLRAGLMRDPAAFAAALRDHIVASNARLAALGADPLDPDADSQPYLEAAEQLAPFLRDTALLINERLEAGERVLCEGAQGTLLDLDHGDYPFVTSSNPTVGGALTGLGFGPLFVDRVVGVAKCYSTRVGSGPMPTELEGPVAERLRGTGEHFWDEFGTTTGRPRRCGWLDAVLLRYTARINGFTELVLTKLDVLTGFDEIKVAHSYRLDGDLLDFPPSTLAELERVEPVYEVLSGWDRDIGQARSAHDLPSALRAYLDRIAELCATPINTVSVGPEREQLVHL